MQDDKQSEKKLKDEKNEKDVEPKAVTDKSNTIAFNHHASPIYIYHHVKGEHDFFMYFGHDIMIKFDETERSRLTGCIVLKMCGKIIAILPSEKRMVLVDVVV